MAIVIPAKDEALTIKSVLKDIQIHLDCDIVVVDDASSDDTGDIVRAFGSEVLPHVTNMGAWRATQTGMRYALKNGYDGIVTFDADGQHKAKFIEVLLKAAKQGNDLVIGSCMSRGSRGRHIAWTFFKRMTGLSVGDLTSGFRFYSRNAIEVLSSRQATMFEYQDVGVLLMLRHVNMKCVEVPVEMDERQYGISRIFHSWFAVWKYLLYTVILSMTKTLPMSAKNYHRKLISGENIE